MNSFIKYTLLVPIFMLSLLTTAWAAQLEWEVVNRFPLFREAAHFEAVKNIWAKSGSAAETVDSEGFTAKLREVLPVRSTAWNPSSGTYDKTVLFRPRHVIKVWLAGVPTGTPCAWSVDGKAAEGTSDCGQGTQIEVNSGKPFTLGAMPDGAMPVVMDVPAIKERLVVALGDSFASGEGNPDHPTVFKPGAASYQWYIQPNPAGRIINGAEWWDEACHRSLLSWPALAAMSRAIANPHEVIQFASFACSGAEVYDGILRAQVDPPGDHVDYLIGKNSYKKRDGGPGYRFDGTEPISGQYSEKGWLPLSQQHALASLLCMDSAPVRVGTLKGPSAQLGVMRHQSYFGDVDLYGCQGKKRAVDQLLISVGGNDVAFGGLVSWIISPPSARNPINQVFLDFARREMKVVEPGQAKTGLRELPKIYDVLGVVLKDFGVEPERVVLLQYPDPTVNPGDLNLCNARTREGNATMQGLVKEKLRRQNFLFGINTKEFKQLRDAYILPLRKVQADTSKRLGWSLVDSQLAIEGIETRGYCGVSAECSGLTCSKGDRVKWWINPAYTNTPRLKALNEFDAYDASRVRGFRYGTDALLAAAAPAAKGKIRHDWFSGSAHPTANTHARIADIVTNIAKVSQLVEVNTADSPDQASIPR